MADEELREAVEDTAAETETAYESETEARDDVTPERAHEIGEFDDLRGMLRDVLNGIAALRESIGAIALSGAVVAEDVDADGDVDAISLDDGEFITPLDELDLSM